MHFGVALSCVSLGVFGTSLVPYLVHPYLACLQPNKQFEKDYGLKKNLSDIQDQWVMLQVSKIQKEVKWKEYGEKVDHLNQEEVCRKIE